MKNRFVKKLILALLVILAPLSIQAQANSTLPKTEFRGVWIATVVNIDWPKQNTDVVVKQQKDYLELLDTYQKLNFNAVIVQIRSVGDAFYPTELAPWSRFLTGKEGVAPNPYYDTLAWMIDQAHSRGLEFHAWLNPYRATFDLNTEQLSSNHDVKKHPEWMIKYGTKIYYNPALPEVKEHLIKIVEEVVTKYDVDAIHFDDYFYPYRIENEKFNDDESFKKYGNGMTLDNFRRNNVDTFVEMTYTAIKKIKPWVQFGISPFGVWRNQSKDPRGSNTKAGQTNYDDLYADILLWDQKGWMDYCIPQLYWSLDHKTVSYRILSDWWSENTKKSNLYTGNGSYKINADSNDWKNKMEIPNQIDYSRKTKGMLGNGYFSAKSFQNSNKDVVAYLSNNQYKYPALAPVVPASKSHKTEKPILNTVTLENDFIRIDFAKPTVDKIRYVLVYQNNEVAKLTIEDIVQLKSKNWIKDSAVDLSIRIDKNSEAKTNNFAITFLNYYGVESEAIKINLSPTADKTVGITYLQ